MVSPAGGGRALTGTILVASPVARANGVVIGRGLVILLRITQPSISYTVHFPDRTLTRATPAGHDSYEATTSGI